jgi:YD repeat-containing protein
VQPAVLDAGPAVDVPDVRPRSEYAYDAYGNLTRIRDAKGRDTTFAADQHGRRTSRTLPLGQVESFQYDALGRLTRLEHKLGASVLASFADTLDAAGHRTRVVEDRPGTADDRTVDYAYDALYRLSREFIDNASLADRELKYTYDLVGNRMTPATTAGRRTRCS